MKTTSLEPPRDAAPRTATLRDYLGVSLYWLALSFLWGALLTIALPARVEALFGAAASSSPAARDAALKAATAALTKITALGAAVAAVSQLAFGALSDGSRSRFGRRRPFFFWGTLLSLPPLLLLSHAFSLPAVLAVFCALQLTVNIAGGPYGALMHDLIPPAKHGTASAWIGVSGSVGRIGGPLVASLLLGRGMDAKHPDAARDLARSQSNFDLLMWIFAGVLLVVMLMTLFLAREKPGDAEPRALATRLADTFRVPLRPYPDFVWLVLSRFGIMMGIYTVSFGLYYYVQASLGFSKNETPGIVTNFLVLATLTGIMGTIRAGVISDKIGRKAVLYAANIICMASGLCFALASDVRLAYLAAGVFGAGFGAFASVDWALATGLLPPREPAKYMGVWGLSDTVSQVVAPVAAGSLALAIGHRMGAGAGYRALMLLSLVWFFVGTIALKPIREPQEKGGN